MSGHDSDCTHGSLQLVGRGERIDTIGGDVLALLGCFHHWRLQVENDGDRRRYSCTIRHGGREVSAYRGMPQEAALAAIRKLKEKMAGKPPRLKLVRDAKSSAPQGAPQSSENPHELPGK